MVVVEAILGRSAVPVVVVTRSKESLSHVVDLLGQGLSRILNVAVSDNERAAQLNSLAISINKAGVVHAVSTWGTGVS